MDEAGYGPNLGPLVVAATAWEVEDEGSGLANQGDCGLRIADCGFRSQGNGRQSAIRNPKSEIDSPRYDLHRSLRRVVAKRPSTRRIAIADSKVLYHPGHGLRQLERGVHAVLLAMRQSPSCWSEIVKYCQADPDSHHLRACWPEGFDCCLPIDASADEIAQLGARFQRACDAAAVRPLAIRARLVFPAQFNDLVADYGSKGAALSHITVGLLREITDALHAGRFRNPDALTPPSAFPPPPSIHAVCDKHGGRSYYTALLQHHFSEHWIEPIYETRAESRYEWGPPDARVSVAFRVEGERFLPTALASMTAKYLRELAMRAFNEYWCALVPGLRSTAGYPNDAHRFRNDIAAAQRELGIDDRALWRNR